MNKRKAPLDRLANGPPKRRNALQEFMDAHRGWYKDHGYGDKYKDIMDNKARSDYNALPDNVRLYYKTAAHNHDALRPGSPPCKDNNWKLPRHKNSPAAQRAFAHDADAADHDDAGGSRNVGIAPAGQNAPRPVQQPAGGDGPAQRPHRVDRNRREPARHRGPPIHDPARAMYGDDGPSDDDSSISSGYTTDDDRLRYASGLPKSWDGPIPAEANAWGWVDPGDSLNIREPSGYPIDDPSLRLENTEWRRVKELGKGGYGVVDLWVEVDTTSNNIVDRIALKTNILTKEQWYDHHTSWIDHPEPREVYSEVSAMRVVHGNQTSHVGKKYILEYRGNRVVRRYRCVKKALPLSVYGDMYAMLQKWCGLHPNGNLPKAFIVDTFLGLAQACQHMVNNNILHDDLKPSNILFSDDEEAHMKEFAHAADKGGTGWGLKPLITDFGIAKPIVDNKWGNPGNWRWGLGTTGYIPPEQIMYKSEAGAVTRLTYPGEAGDKLDEKGQVFALGAIIFWLMHARQSEHPYERRRIRYFQFQKRIRDEQTGILRTKNENLYLEPPRTAKKARKMAKEQFNLHKINQASRSRGLTKLLLDCLAFSPRARPTLAQVIKYLEAERQYTPTKQDPELFAGTTSWWRSNFKEGDKYDDATAEVHRKMQKGPPERLPRRASVDDVDTLIQNTRKEITPREERPPRRGRNAVQQQGRPLAPPPLPPPPPPPPPPRPSQRRPARVPRRSGRAEGAVHELNPVYTPVNTADLPASPPPGNGSPVFRPAGGYTAQAISPAASPVYVPAEPGNAYHGDLLDRHQGAPEPADDLGVLQSARPAFPGYHSHYITPVRDGPPNQGSVANDDVMVASGEEHGLVSPSPPRRVRSADIDPALR